MSKVDSALNAVETARGKVIYYRNQTNGGEYELLDRVAKILNQLTIDLKYPIGGSDE